MKTQIVLGHTFGDEGKGVTVQWLCRKALEEGKRPLVMRFSGGPQAAHTIFNRGTEHICSSFGSGVLLDVPTAYTKDVYLDPICLMNEYKVLKSKGINPKLYLAPCRIITPYDVFAGIHNSKVRSDGTCGKGIYPTFERYCNVKWGGLFGCTANPESMLKTVANYYQADRMPEYDAMFKKAWLEMQTEIYTDRPPLQDIDVLIIEGSQGLLLDMDHGFFPHVTPSKVGLNGIPEYYLKDTEVYLVTRTYTTRHGNGYEPKQPLDIDLSCKYESNITNEYQGNFKTGVLEIGLLNIAYQRHCIDNYLAKYNMSLNLVVTHMDVPLENHKFEILHQGGTDGFYGRTTELDVINLIHKHLCYTPNRVFYNSGVESNLIELENYAPKY